MRKRKKTIKSQTLKRCQKLEKLGTKQFEGYAGYTVQLGVTCGTTPEETATYI